MKKLMILVMVAAAMKLGAAVRFEQARAVWPKGEAETLNSSCVLTTEFAAHARDHVTLRITGANVYRIRLNAKFAGYGPARACHGYARVDEWALAPADGINHLEIEALVHNVDNFYFPKEAGFVRAEVLVNGKVVKWTGGGGHFAAHATNRLRKTSRTDQRPFTECVRLGAKEAPAPLELELCPELPLLPRRAEYPTFEVREMSIVGATANRYDANLIAPYRTSTDASLGEYRKCFPIDELEMFSWQESNRLTNYATRLGAASSLKLGHLDGALVDLGRLNTGFTGFRAKVTKPCKVYLLVDEVLRDDHTVNHMRGSYGMISSFIFERPGEYAVETFEPNAFRYLNAVVMDGEAELSGFYLREYVSPAARRQLNSDDPELQKIYTAAVNTFAQNAVDVFTDCPGRERAGWLCDSWFTARTSYLLTGSLDLETLFLENFLLPEKFAKLPEGMFPMCYPADHNRGRFIPNWAMWLVLQLEEYQQRGGDARLVKRFEPKVMQLIAALDKYLNSDGLLEKLPEWVFVEWSRCNDLVQDVNYPSNMTYAEMLGAAGRLYGRADLLRRADEMRETIRRQSWTGEWFCDNAVRGADGKLHLSGECTETCQYYAFFFKTATKQSHPRLWQRLVNEFGPDRVKAGRYPKIWPSNAFIGNYLRLELLSREGLGAQIDREIRGYFLYMAERTGTLWEFVDPTRWASCCHGFAAYAAVLICRDVLGDADIVRTQRDFTFPGYHLEFTAVELKDQTDLHNELVSVRKWQGQWNEQPVTLSGLILDVRDLETQAGTVFLRLSPLPHARPVRCDDYAIDFRDRRVTVISNGYDCVVLRYRNGDVGRTAALHQYQRKVRPYRAGRDGVLLSNTWGDGNSDTRLNEQFVLGEIRAGGKLGVDVVQIDDGWQHGRTANSLILKDRAKGVWNGYWAADPNFWAMDAARFPGGFERLMAECRRNGVRLGLWFGPDSSNEAANWQKDADLLLGYFREYGIANYKIDSMKTTTPLSLRRQRAFFDRLKGGSEDVVTCDLDVTAEIRPGYFGLPDVGTLFVENRYAKHCSYWPQYTLRNLWMLSKYIDPVRLRMEFINPLRLKAERYDDRFPGSPLAPANWKGDELFATVMVASPLAWFELQNLAPQTADELRPLIAAWKRERANLHGGDTFPIGEVPNGFSWTGFFTLAADGQSAYALVFREAAADASHVFELKPLLPRAVKSVEPIYGSGGARIEGTQLIAEVPAKLGYAWVRLTFAE